MSVPADPSVTAGDGAAITTGEDAVVEPGAAPAEPAAPSGGTETETVTDPGKDDAAPEADAETPGETEAKTEAKTEEEEPLTSLGDLAARRAGEREKAETEEAEARAKAEKGEEEPAPGKDAATKDDAATPGKTEAEAEPEEEGQEAAAEPEKPEDLKVEDVDTVHEKDSPSARERIKALAITRDTLKAELTPLQETIEVLGGRTGVDEILKKIEIIENPERSSEFLELVEQSPLFSDFKTKHFWAELDNVDNQALIAADRYGDGYTPELIDKLVDLHKRGVINLAEIETRDDTFRLSDEQLAEKKAERTETERLRIENAELKRVQTEGKQTEEQTAVAQRWQQFGTSYDTDLFPMLKELGVLPLPDDAPEIAEAKERHWQHIVDTSQAEYAKNAEFQEIAKLIKAGATDTITYRNKLRGFKPVYLDIAKQATVKELPFLNGTLDALYKQGKGKAKTATAGAAAQPQNPPPPAAPAAPPPEKAQELQTAAPVAAAGPDLRDKTDRKTAFARAAERSAANRRE